jgi:2-haloacid dehalogenase
MLTTRRNMLEAGLAVAASALLESPARPAVATPKYKAMAFDAFAVFDPRPVAALAEHLYPAKGDDLTNLWRTRQFEYAWLRTISGRYRDFMRVTEDSLIFATNALGIELTADNRNKLLQLYFELYFELRAWPEATSVLHSLKLAGIRLALLSNFTPAMLAGSIKTASLEGLFEQVLSTDFVETFKPDTRAYQLGSDVLGLARQEILFVAFAGWDAVGAKTFGYPTFWVNRFRLPPEELGAIPDAAGASLVDLATFVGL